MTFTSEVVADIDYADDTLIMVLGDTVEVVQKRANTVLAIVSGHVRELGLHLAVDKMVTVNFKNRFESAEEEKNSEPDRRAKRYPEVLERDARKQGVHVRRALTLGRG